MLKTISTASSAKTQSSEEYFERHVNKNTFVPGDKSPTFILCMDKESLQKELSYKTSRSGGAGGQHVNKVESKVTLVWDVHESEVLTEEEKTRVRQKLANRLNKDGLLQMESSTDRSQTKNKEIVTNRFFHLLQQALKKEKKRIATKIPKSQILDRLDRKKKQSQKKQGRSKNFRFD